MVVIRSKSQINKTSNLPNGVSRIVEFDKRLANPKAKIRFSVLVYVKGKSRLKSFRVSEKASEEKAEKSAIAFRQYYEYCEERNIDFDFNSFNNWNAQ